MQIASAPAPPIAASSHWNPSLELAVTGVEAASVWLAVSGGFG